MHDSLRARRAGEVAHRAQLARSCACCTMLLWGVWGAFAGLPGEHGVPETLNYVVWALTMIPPAIIVLRMSGSGAQARSRARSRSVSRSACSARAASCCCSTRVRIGPPYLIFPIISLSPALTIALSFALLRERTGKLGVLGIALALLSLPLFDYRADGEAAGLRPVVPARAAAYWSPGACRRTSSSSRTRPWMPRASSST